MNRYLEESFLRGMSAADNISGTRLNKALKRVGRKLVPDLSKPVRMPNSGSSRWMLNAIDRAGVPNYETTLYTNAQRRKVRREIQRDRDELAKKIREQRKLLRSGTAKQRRAADEYFNGILGHKWKRDARGYPIKDFRAGVLNPSKSDAIV